MNKVLKFLLSIVTTFSITSCGLDETNENSGNSGLNFGDSGLGTTEDTTPASNNTPSSETPSSGESESEPEQLEDEVIELSHENNASNSRYAHFNDEYTLFFENDVEYDEISYELESADDTEFFQITKNSDTLVIKAIRRNRFTYLTLVYKKNSITVKTKKYTLLSVSYAPYSTSYDGQQLGETLFDLNKYAQYRLYSMGINNRQEDLVIPSSITIDGEVKEVIEVFGAWYDYYVRRVYIPDTVCTFTPTSFGCVRCFDYVKFSKSKWGFILFQKESIIDALEATGLFTESGNYLSCFIKGENYYDFPYKNVGISANLTWNSGVSSWDWQTNFINYYKNGVSDQNSQSWQTYLSLKQSFADNNYYFCN